MKKMILLSIHPEFADLIIAGKKKYEYRKAMPSETVSHIALYSTYPVQRIVAIVEVVDEISDTPCKLWRRTSKNGAISKKRFNEYFSGKNLACAFKLGEVNVFDEPISLQELSVNNPPQSFQYLSSVQIALMSK